MIYLGRRKLIFKGTWKVTQTNLQKVIRGKIQNFTENYKVLKGTIFLKNNARDIRHKFLFLIVNLNKKILLLNIL